MNNFTEPFGATVAILAKTISDLFCEQVDMLLLSESRTYIIEIQENLFKPAIVSNAKAVDSNDMINQIYFQIVPNATPQLCEEEFCAGVCIENIGGWNIREHNLTHIKDIVEDNVFFKWWYFECLRMNVAGWTRVYYDPYLEKDIVTYSMPVYGNNDFLMGVLGIDLDYNYFTSRINKRLVENIKKNVETLKREHENIGNSSAMDNQFINVNTYEIINSNNFSSISFHSEKMTNVIELVKRAAIGNANVLLLGETGVGKDYIAKEIHLNSQSASGPFINVNCCALAENLIESELFGYGQGSFTGAEKSGKPGYFEAADKGTILLNEIGDLPLRLQAKLLNVIQDKEIVRIGETKKRKVDFRFIAATNKDLKRLVEAGSFREDLYYRLNVIPIYIPPLRERKSEIFPLISAFLKENTQKYNIEKQFSVELVNLLTEYDWPGNIRELENLIERLILTTASETLSTDDLPKEILERINLLKLSNAAQVSNILPKISAADKKATHQEEFKALSKKSVEAVEAKIIKEKYRELGSSYKVAKALGISQSSAYKKIQKYVFEKIK